MMTTTIALSISMTANSASCAPHPCPKQRQKDRPIARRPTNASNVYAPPAPDTRLCNEHSAEALLNTVERRRSHEGGMEMSHGEDPGGSRKCSPGGAAPGLHSRDPPWSTPPGKKLI